MWEKDLSLEIYTKCIIFNETNFVNSEGFWEYCAHIVDVSRGILYYHSTIAVELKERQNITIY
jgi:hypothetical protein